MTTKAEWLAMKTEKPGANELFALIYSGCMAVCSEKGRAWGGRVLGYCVGGVALSYWNSEPVNFEYEGWTVDDPGPNVHCRLETLTVASDHHRLCGQFSFDVCCCRPFGHIGEHVASKGSGRNLEFLRRWPNQEERARQILGTTMKLEGEHTVAVVAIDPMAVADEFLCFACGLGHDRLSVPEREELGRLVGVSTKFIGKGGRDG